MPDNTRRTERSFCRICTSICGVLVDISGDQIVKVRGDREHPISRGYTCPKGRALPKIHHHPNRLERPQMRKGGSLQAVSWDECLDDLTERLRGVIERHGPEAVGIYFGSGLGMDTGGYRLSELLHSAIKTPAKFTPVTIDGTAKILVTSLMGGFPGLSARPDYNKASLVIYVGINPVVSHGHAIAMPMPPSKTVQSVTRRGETWVIDPRFTETARFASRHIAPRPGKDYAILAYLVREILECGANAEVIARHSVDSGTLRRAVAPFDRQYSADIAGVHPEELDDLLAAVRKAGRIAVDTGTGVTMSAEANVTQWLAWALMILTDSMNRPGGIWFHPGFFRQMEASGLPILPSDTLFAPGPPSRPDLQGFLGEWPCAALADEINAGNIRAFINLGGNMITAFPDENALRPALEKLDTLVTFEIIANETTALSTHVLPTKDQLERPDISFWDMLSSRVSAQYTPAMVDAVGDRRSSWWILSQILQRLGHEVPDYIPADDRAEGADEQVVATIAQGGRRDFDDWKEDFYAEIPHELPAAWVDEHIRNLGGWRLAPRILVDQLSGLHVGESSTLRLTPRRQQRHVNAQLVFLGDIAEMLIHPSDAATLGIADGQHIIVRSNRGEITGVAKVDEGIRQGVISVPHGFENANVNRLTNAREADPVTGMALYSGIPVDVIPFPGTEQTI